MVDMIMLTKDEIVQKLIGYGLSKEEITTKIDKKKSQMSGVSEDGIALMVAKEAGVNIVQPILKELKIGSVIPNMRNITLYGKIIDKQPIREFRTENGTGRVQNIILADDTGRIRMSLWNDEIDKMSFEIGSVVKLINCVTRKDNLDNPELRMGYNGAIEKSDAEIEMPPAKTRLADAVIGDDIEAEATILEIFERPLIYYFCPECRSKLFNGVCPEHGSVDLSRVSKTLIVSGIVDDGSKTINMVMFNKPAEQFLDKNTDDIENILANKTVTEFINDAKLVGARFKIYGAIRSNKTTQEPEIRVNRAERLA